MIFKEEGLDEENSFEDDSDDDEVTVGVESLGDEDERIEDIIDDFESDYLEEIENRPD